MKYYIESGFRPLDGFQLRYIYFLDQSCRERLTVPELPYSEIQRVGASMYKGVRAGIVHEVGHGNQPKKALQDDLPAPLVVNDGPQV